MSTTRDRGQSLVEFALLLPIFALFLFGIFDFGRAVYAYNTINNAAREGARWAIVDQTESHIQAHAASHGVALGISDADIDIDYRLVTTPDVAGSCNSRIGTDGIASCIAVVTVPYDYQAVTPLIGNIVGTLQLVGESQFKVDFNCVGPSCPLGE